MRRSGSGDSSPRKVWMRQNVYSIASLRLQARAETFVMLPLMKISDKSSASFSSSGERGANCFKYRVGQIAHYEPPRTLYTALSGDSDEPADQSDGFPLLL